MTERTSIFIRSYQKDYEWLSFCLKSLAKFASGFHEIIVTVPEGQAAALRHLTAEKVIPVHDAQPGYLGQQVSKLTADRHTAADYILHIDSDCIFTKPVTPETFMRDGKVNWLITPWSECPDAFNAWAHVMVKCVRKFPQFDYMRKSTLMVPRWAYGEFRKFIEKTHGYTMEAYVMNQPNKEFSEYNCLGFYCHEFHRKKINWQDTSVEGVPDIGDFQSWSWGGLTPEIRQKLEGLLR